MNNVAARAYSEGAAGQNGQNSLGGEVVLEAKGLTKRFTEGRLDVTVLHVLDELWKDHLSTMDHLRHGIHLRGYAQKNPKQEYKRESFTLFQELLDSIKHDTIRVLSFVQVRREDPAEEEARLRREAEEMAKRMQFQHAEAASALAPAEEVEQETPAPVAATPVRSEPKVGRNEPCPCGSGKKYKHCHGQVN